MLNFTLLVPKTAPPDKIGQNNFQTRVFIRDIADIIRHSVGQSVGLSVHNFLKNLKSAL